MIGKLLGNRYEILNKIGEGGMALVYTGKCTLLNRIVAIKILKSEFSKDEEFLEKFKNEAQSAARVNHPNIINVYDVGQDKDESYIVMEYVDGKNLKDMIKTNGRMPEAIALDIADQIARALQLAHSKGIVHRDIKSHNIMLTSNNIVKVGDFGIAKAVSSATITAVGSIMGSVHYFSPEQARGGFVDERSDIYSLGIVLFEMLTGRLPFDGETPVNIALKQIQDNIEFLPSDNIRPEVKNLIVKLTQKSPDRRYKSAGEVINEIAILRGNRPSKIVDPAQIIKEDFQTNKKQPQENQNITTEEENQEQEHKKSFKLTIIAILTALLFAIVGVGGFMLFGGFDGILGIFSKEETIELEDFRGLTLEDAKKRGEILGIQIVQDGTEVNSNYPEDTIASQSPSKGVKVPKDSLVKVTISTIEIEEVTVPNVIGFPLEEAIKILNSEGLSEAVKTEESDKPKDEVISQTPSQGTTVTKGELIQLVISEGPKEPEEPEKNNSVPNAVGKSVEEARQILASFTLTESYREDKQKKNGTVLSQTPEAGTMVEDNATINIVINRIEQSPIVSYPFLVMLPTDSDTIAIKIVEKNTGEEIYNAQIDPNSVEGVLKINVSGEQGQTKVYSVYIDGKVWGDQEVTFQ